MQIELLIPTYKREKIVIANIKSMVKALPEGVTIACCSNRPSGLLEKELGNEISVRYIYNATNKGALYSIKRLINSCEAEFFMLLSDEDMVDVGKLNHIANQISVNITDAVLPIDIECFCFNLAGKFVKINPMKWSYISGIIMSTKIRENRWYESCFNSNLYNVYPHLLLILSLLKGSIFLYSESLLIKGKEAGYGGDSHSHVDIGNGFATKKLNPMIYSSNSRLEQERLFISIAHEIIDSFKFNSMQSFFLKLRIKLSWISIYFDAKNMEYFTYKNYIAIVGCRLLGQITKFMSFLLWK